MLAKQMQVEKIVQVLLEVDKLLSVFFFKLKFFKLFFYYQLNIISLYMDSVLFFSKSQILSFLVSI